MRNQTRYIVYYRPEGCKTWALSIHRYAHEPLDMQSLQDAEGYVYLRRGDGNEYHIARVELPE
jgi:hypothetical protein